jgi:hypothetical protein
MADDLTFILDGEDILPGAVALADLGYMLQQFELAVKDVARSVGDNPEAIKIALTEIRSGSVEYALVANNPAKQHTAAIAAAVNHRDGTSIPWSARRKVELIHGRAKKKNMAFGVRGEKSPGIQFSFKVQPNDKLFDAPRTRGATSILAYIIKAGGDPGNLTSEIRTSDGQRLTAAVRSEDVALQLGALLHQTVELHGVAVWNSENWKLHHFSIDEVGAYRKKDSDPVAALGQLHAISGEFWDQIDVTAYFNDLRSGGAEAGT